jgi:hypothetical protein
MSKRNGPSAREHAAADDRDTRSSRGGMPTSIPSSRLAPAQRYSRAEYAKVLALQDEVSRADTDYQRLRSAYMDIAHREPTHEVALAMVGADMDRAHARLQALIGLPRLPFTHEPSAVMRREAQRGSGEKH